MVTIYDLLEVDERASKEEIQKAYQKLVLEYAQNPNLTAEENADNELIMNKVKIAYTILMDDVKRDKYDKDLAKKRAEELLKNVSTTTEQVKEEPSVSQKEVDNDDEYDDGDYDDSYEDEQYNETQNEEVVELSKEEQKRLQKAAQDEFKANLKKAQKAEEEYNKAYNEAYNNYMRKLGYNVKEPMTLKRVMNVVIFIVVAIVVCIIAWLIPPIRKILTDIYNENFIIKALVDIVGMIFKSIFSIFKK